MCNFVEHDIHQCIEVVQLLCLWIPEAENDLFPLIDAVTRHVLGWVSEWVLAYNCLVNPVDESSVVWIGLWSEVCQENIYAASEFGEDSGRLFRIGYIVPYTVQSAVISFYT